MNIYLAMFHGRVADQHKSHLSQVMSPKPSRPKRSSLKTSSPEELSFDRNLGTDPYQIQERFIGDIYQNTIAEDVEGFGKVGADMSYIQSQELSDNDSAESIDCRLGS